MTNLIEYLRLGIFFTFWSWCWPIWTNRLQPWLCKFAGCQPSKSEAQSHKSKVHWPSSKNMSAIISYLQVSQITMERAMLVAPIFSPNFLQINYTNLVQTCHELMLDLSTWEILVQRNDTWPRLLDTARARVFRCPKEFAWQQCLECHTNRSLAGNPKGARP